MIPVIAKCHTVNVWYRTGPDRTLQSAVVYRPTRRKMSIAVGHILYVFFLTSSCYLLVPYNFSYVMFHRVFVVGCNQRSQVQQHMRKMREPFLLPVQGRSVVIPFILETTLPIRPLDSLRESCWLQKPMFDGFRCKNHMS